MGPQTTGPYWTDIGLFATGVATLLIVAVGAAFALAQVRTAVRSASLQALGLLENRWQGELLRRVRRIANQLGPELGTRLDEWDKNNSEEIFEMMALLDFFEQLGFLCKDGGKLVNDYVREIYGPAARHYFELYRAYIEKYRGEQPELGRFFEELAISCA